MFYYIYSSEKKRRKNAFQIKLKPHAPRVMFEDINNFTNNKSTC